MFLNGDHLLARVFPALSAGSNALARGCIQVSRAYHWLQFPGACRRLHVLSRLPLIFYCPVLTMVVCCFSDI